MIKYKTTKKNMINNSTTQKKVENEKGQEEGRRNKTNKNIQQTNEITYKKRRNKRDNGERNAKTKETRQRKQ